jgi:putative FmdB family regulatory protein
MPMYDFKCQTCGALTIDVLAPMSEARRDCPACGPAQMCRVILPGKANAVIGDEIDVTIRHGLVDETTGAPIRYRSREALRKEAERRGLTNRVEHVGESGSDKARATTRWI